MNYSETVNVSQLDNGFTIATDVVPNAVAAFVSVNLRCGSHHDPNSQMGLMHLSEHLASNGAPGFTRDSAMAYADDNALEANFATGDDHTSYYVHGLPADALNYMDKIMGPAVNQSAYDQAHFL